MIAITLTTLLIFAAIARADDIGLQSTAAPQPWPSSMLGPVPGRLHLPVAAFDGKGRVADSAQQRAMPIRASADLPDVAWDLGPALTRPNLPPATPTAYSLSPDPARLVPPWRETPPDAALPTIASNPVLAAARVASMAGVPELRQKPAPFLRLAIPDPSDPGTPIRLEKTPPDADAPVATFDVPPTPDLPVQPLPKP